MRVVILRYLFACMAIAMLAPIMARAQTALGSDCSKLTQLDGQQQTITLTEAAKAGQWIIVSVVVNNTYAQFDATNPVTDSAGNSYAVFGTVALSGRSGALATFAGRATNLLPASASIFINYGTTGSSSAQSCATASAFPGVLALSDPSDVAGAKSGTGPSLGVTSSSPTQYANELVYSAFASTSTPGNVVAIPPAQGLNVACSSDNTLCLLPAWNLGETMAGIFESADAQGDNAATPWGALLITFQNDDRIFADGFE